MSEENVATVQAIWDALNRGDADEATERMPEDFVFDFSSSENPESGVYRGRESLKRVFQSLTEPWSEVEYFALEYIAAGDHVVRVGGMRARGEGSGAEVTARGAQVWTFRDGTPTSMRLYQSKDEALKAIGIEPGE